MGVLLRTVDLKKTYNTGANEVHALNNVSIEIHEGQITAIRGRSGSGKTTLLNVVGTLDEPDKGEVYFQGKNILKFSEMAKNNLRRKDFAFIFQSIALMPNMTAFENVEFALRLANVKERSNRVDECLKYVGMYERRKHMPSELSGGEQQRIAIARAIAHKPKIIFADEPTAQVDTKMALQIIDVFRKLVEKENVTIVMTTHDLSILDKVDHIYAVGDVIGFP
ncbi:MAG TPA: ATP-binding cassette domain-containing protein, partial [Clostridia bacterium]|nr:ATP-binding cassette domain-containing protein [Clostridia bacterium]